jgi:tetratricopeptide (TPR) repeat protein
MPTIEIQQKNGFEAIVAIAGAEFAITVSDPFAQSEEKRLEWYFEQWIQCPFTDGTIAERAAASVRSYGENLFEQVFSGRAYGAYQRVNGQLSDLEIVISGDPEFQGLHWEAMWDKDFDRPLAVDCVMVRRRRVRGMVSAAQVQESPVLNLLIVTARPDEEGDVGYRTISRPMVEAIRDGQLRVNVEIVRPGTFEAFVRQLEAKPEGFYHMVHFDLHGGLMSYEQFQACVQQDDRSSGNYTFRRGYGLGELPQYAGVKGFLFFEAEQKGEAVPVAAEEMAGRLQGRGIPVCILNACHSGKQTKTPDLVSGEGQPSPLAPLPNLGEGDRREEGNQSRVDDRETSLGARLMDAGMQMVVAMGYSVTVDAAKLLMGRVYGELFGGKGLPGAVRSGRRELFNHKQRRVYFNQQVDLEDWLLPVVYGNGAVNFGLREMTFAETNEYFAWQGTEYRFGGTTYGFVGRDLDILKLEKALLRQGVVLIRGMGGTGKTTLLRYLQDWWVQTNFVEQVFYFGYDTKAWTLEQILFAIAEAVFADSERRQFQAMRLEARVGMLVQKLRSRRFGVMLDNLESVTGQALAIQNTLLEAERGQIRSFLERIVGGQTIVLLGSRSGEEWLRSVFRESRYELRGLDREARSELAQQVLERHVGDGAKRKAILADKDFERLMRLLAGYPLAIEVVLANLGRQTVAQVLAGLDAGDVNLDSDSEKTTESILRCVEYSHSNLSAEAQKLLLCLAPFSGFIDRSDLPNYAQQLQQLEPFQDYPFEQLDKAVQEAINWGLLAPIAEVNPRLLSIQPVFPYFLKTKLNEQDAATREALRTGFKNHYLGLANSYNQLMNSKDAQEHQLGIFFCNLEYENLYSALQICLERQDRLVLSIHVCLSGYLEKTGDKKGKLQLIQLVYSGLEAYSVENKTQEIELTVLGLLDQLGGSYLELKDYEVSRSYYQKSLKLINIRDDLPNEVKGSLVASTYGQLGRVDQALREYDQARANYQKAIQIYVEFNDRYSQARIYHGLGTVTQELHEYDQAHANYQQALQIYVEFNDRYSQASTYHNLGTVAEELREYEQAWVNYQQALQIKVEFNDRYSQASTYHQLGIVAQELREYEQARVNYQQALQIYIEFNDRYSQAHAYHQLGIIAQKLREYDQARADYQKALQIYVEFNDLYSQAPTYYQLGTVAHELRELDQARVNYQKALQIKAEFNDHSSTVIYHQLVIVTQELFLLELE